MLLSYKPYGVLRYDEETKKSLETLVRKGITKEFNNGNQEFCRKRDQFFVDASRRILCDYCVFDPCDTDDQVREANKKINRVRTGGYDEAHAKIYPILVTYRAVQALYYERLSEELHQRRWSSRWKQFWTDFPRKIKYLWGNMPGKPRWMQLMIAIVGSAIGGFIAYLLIRLFFRSVG